MRKKRARTDVLDNAYHRFSSHDDNLPRWFYEDEKRHRLCAPGLLARVPSLSVVAAFPIKQVPARLQVLLVPDSALSAP